MTIPADIYSSGIIVEAEGIHVHLRVLPETNQTDSGEASTHGKTGETIIPSTADLAQSFLAAEPREETEELQAALSSQSQHLPQPDAFSSDEEDDDIGLQENVSLPSFVAGFFKGVLDRLQLKISDVTLRVDMELSQDGTSKHSSGEGRDPITGMLTIQDISIDGVATETVENERLKVGKRLATLSEVHFMLVADPSVFDSHSRFNQPVSPSVSGDGTSHRGAPSPQPSASTSSSYHTMAQSTMFERHAFHGERSQHLEDSTYSQGRFSDAATEDGYGPEDDYDGPRSMTGSQDEEMFLESPAYLDEALQYDDDLENSTGTLSPPSTRRVGDTSGRQPETSSSDDHTSHSSIAERTNQSTPSPSLLFQSSRDVQNKLSQSSSSSSSTSVGDAGTRPDDLSQSRIFTHEEAQSMYMSAMSHASDSSLPQMPGSWGSPKSSSTLMDHLPHQPSLEAEQPNNTTTNEDTGASTPKASTILESGHRDEEDTEGDAVSDAPEHQIEDKEDAPPQSSEDISGLVKNILGVKNVTLWIPSFDDTPPEDALPDLPKQSAHRMKESTFSLGESVMSDAGGNSKFRLSSSFLGRQPNVPGRAEDVFEELTESETTRAVEVDIGSISVKFDIACGWLLVKMGQRLVSTWKPKSSPEEVSEQQTAVSPPVTVSLSTCRVHFLGHLPGKVYVYSALYNSQIDPSREDVILRLDLSDTEFSTITTGRRAKYCVKVSKFTFGHASEDIISFDDRLDLCESTRDVTGPARGDIFVSVTTSPIFSEMHLTTLPLRVCLNLNRLDETLAWLGGLSTVLELGNSVASTTTIRERRTGPRTKPKTKPRGVHFERTPAELPENQSNGIPLKVNCRIAGLAVDLNGEKCSLKLETSTIKIVSRFGIMGLFVTKGRLSGPSARSSNPDTLPNVGFREFKLEYRSEPNEEDLDRMLNMLTPSQDKSSEEEDDIMLGTLVRQRKKGGLMSLTFSNVSVSVPHLELLAPLSSLGDELAKLSTVAKYIPQDDSPGIMTLALIRELEGQIYLGKDVGTIDLSSENFEACYVSFPSLIALSISKIMVYRNGSEELIGETIPEKTSSDEDRLPMVMLRYIADEMEPTVKLKLFNLRAEYTVPSLTAFLGLSSEMTAEDIAANMAHSVVNLAELKVRHGESFDESTQSSAASDNASKSPIPSRLSVIMRDCLLGLNPRQSPAKGFVVFTNAQFSGSLNEDEPSEATLQVQKASLVIIDDVANVGLMDNIRGRKSPSTQTGLVRTLEDMGFVPVCSTSSVRVVIKIMQLEAEGEKSLDVELKDELLILETCADSTQTLITILNGLAPPSPPNKTLKYRTEVIPIEDMLGSFSGDAFAMEQPSGSGGAGVEKLSPIDENEADELEYVSDFYPPGSDKSDGGFEELLDSFHSEAQMSSSVTDLDFQADHFAKKSAVGGTAHRWDSSCNTYSLANEVKLHGSPLRVRVRDVHVIWNLFDGYDWQRTRDTISKAVKDVQSKAAERQARAPPVDEDDEESVIGDFLFNSVYIGIPTNRDPRELSHEINRNIDDLVSDSGSFATSTTVTAAPNHPSNPKRERLRLARSKHHKMTFELKGIAADMVVFPPSSGETQSSLDIRVRDLDIFDHLPMSTWKKFATYMQDVGEREIGASMVHLEILNVKPVAELAASELIVKVCSRIFDHCL